MKIRNLAAVRDDDFGVDGVFGFKSFGDMNVLVDLPFDLSTNLPAVPMVVGSATVATLIDTGDDAFAWEVRSADLKGAAFVHEPVAAERVLNGARPQNTRVTTLASTVGLGPKMWDRAVRGRKRFEVQWLRGEQERKDSFAVTELR